MDPLVLNDKFKSKSNMLSELVWYKLNAYALGYKPQVWSGHSTHLLDKGTSYGIWMGFEGLPLVNLNSIWNSMFVVSSINVCCVFQVYCE